MLSLSHKFQLYLFHNGIRLPQLMLTLLISSLLVFGMLYASAAETDEIRYFPPVVIRITETDGWTCIERVDGKELCLSKYAMAALDEWRDEVRYLPRGNE